MASVLHLSILLSSIFDDDARKVLTLFVEMPTRVCPVVVQGQVSICGWYNNFTAAIGGGKCERCSTYAEEGIVQN